MNEDTSLKGKTVIVTTLDNVADWLRSKGVEGKRAAEIIHGGQVVGKVVYTTEPIPFHCARLAFVIVEIGAAYSTDALAKMTPEQLDTSVELEAFRAARVLDWVGRPDVMHSLH